MAGGRQIEIRESMTHFGEPRGDTKFLKVPGGGCKNILGCSTSHMRVHIKAQPCNGGGEGVVKSIHMLEWGPRKLSTHLRGGCEIFYQHRTFHPLPPAP